MLRAYFLFVLSFFLASFAVASEDTQAFYAISSLRFHVDELISQSQVEDEEGIVFGPEDLEYLWRLAANCPYSNEIAFAQAYYYESEGTNIALLIQVEKILEMGWEKLHLELSLNPEAEKTGSAQKSSNFASQASFATTSIAYDKNNFFLPDDHPLKHNLDQIFSKPNVLENSFSFREAGFTTLHHQDTGMRVASHPLLHGFLIKTYLNSEEKPDTDDWNWMIQRCKGANNIRNLIREQQLRHFTVPDKWIYALPNSTKTDPYTQTAVLVVTHMKIVNDEESRKAWKQATTKQLKELYSILSHGLASSYLPRNIPYTTKKKFSCIDTAYAKRIPNFKKPRSYFSKEMKVYWDKLVKRGGNT